MESGAIFFLLINFTIILLLVVGVILGRNVVKLVFEYKRKTPGSRLRTRLVFAMVGIALVPTLLLVIAARLFIYSALDGWFNSKIDTVVKESVVIAREYYVEQEGALREIAPSIFNQVTADNIDQLRDQHSLNSIRVFNRVPRISEQYASSSPLGIISEFSEPPIDLSQLEKYVNQTVEVGHEKMGGGDFLRLYLVRDDTILVLTKRLKAEIVSAINAVVDAFSQHEEEIALKNPLRSSYILALLLVAAILIFAASWLGFYIARRITMPIQKLASGTSEVAKGNLDFVLENPGDDEFSNLVASFNSMIKDVKLSREEVHNRRVYLESILANLTVGVCVLDTVGNIELANPVAEHLLQLDSDRHGNLLSQLAGPTLKAVEVLLSQGGSDTIRVTRNGQERRIHLSFSPLKGISSSLLLLEDITELSQAQEKATWQEVARRIAHEIKNPLTPILLSAQRLEQQPPSAIVIGESVATISMQVNKIKRLADEFSNFARMPAANLKVDDLNLTVQRAVLPYQINKTADIVMELQANISNFAFDDTQISALVTNLINNAINASVDSRDHRGPPQIFVATKAVPESNFVSITIADNGPGIPDDLKPKVFDPYFTTREDGTGLGLPIVMAIVKEHKGTIRLFDNIPHGAKFVVELPLKID